MSYSREARFKLQQDKREAQLKLQLEQQKIHAFTSYLESRQFLDIEKNEVNKNPQNVQTQVGIDREASYACASHALGNCVVDIIDSFGLNCNQDDITEALAKIKQAKYISQFNHESITVDVWVKGSSPPKYHEIELYLIVQPSYVNINGHFPKMTRVQMDKYKTRMVGYWKNSKNGKQVNHAVYIKSWTMSEEQKYKYLCINSWRDERKPENEIQEEDISDIYYVSLYCEPKHNQSSSDYDYDW